MNDIATPSAPAAEQASPPAADAVQTPTADAPGAGALSPPPAAPTPAAEWLSGLPDELRADATLTRYKSVEDLARGHLETKRLATDKAGIKLPDGSDESVAAFVQAVRPESAEAYEIAVPEGMAPDYVDSFKDKALEIGLLPFQAKALADWDAERQMAAKQELDNQSEASAKDLETFKAEYHGDYEKDLGKVQKMIGDLGVDIDGIAELESKIGTPNIMKMMFNLQSKIGDFDSVVEVATPTGFDAVAPEQASAILSQKQLDPEWRKAAVVKGSREATEWKYLTEMEARHRHRQNQMQNRA